jgi:hypothetical protein
VAVIAVCFASTQYTNPKSTDHSTKAHTVH